MRGLTSGPTVRIPAPVGRITNKMTFARMRDTGPEVLGASYPCRTNLAAHRNFDSCSSVLLPISRLSIEGEHDNWPDTSMDLAQVASRRWSVDEVLASREGLIFPPLVLGTSVMTRVLADVIHLEPVALLGLPDAAMHRHYNLQRIVRTLVQSGLVTKFSQSHRFNIPGRTAFVMNREHPAFEEIQFLVRTIARSVRIEPNQAPNIRGRLNYPDPAVINPQTLLGRPRRTLAIVLAHLRPGIRLVTISRCLGTNPAEKVKIVETLVRDQILSASRFVSELGGRRTWPYRTVSIAQHFWTPALEALIDRLVYLEPHFSSKALIADSLETDAASVMRRRALPPRAPRLAD